MAHDHVEPLPDQHGRTVLVTGANSGIGLESARALAAHGAHVVLACRSRAKADAAVADIRAGLPGVSLETLVADLADLASVRAAAASFGRSHRRLDVLLCNAGVMAVPHQTTADGFELQVGTNHLGHFALTGLLLGPLLAAEAPRVVTVSSIAHHMGRIRFSDLHRRQRYSKWMAYGQSKLANLLFTLELARRAHAAGSDLLAVSAHPGWAATHLQGRGYREEGSRLKQALSEAANRVIAQDAASGALPVLHAAVAPGVRNGDYFGPDGIFELRGRPVRVGASARARDPAVAARLWQVSEQSTGVSFDALAPPVREDSGAPTSAADRSGPPT